jgi:CCR4-NOT transcription complex subunit 3
MEKFKACEKEMKTKAFSKEGLTQTTKLDPKAQEREELIGWVSTHIGTLEQQVETAEAEIESVHGQGKKKKGSAASTRLDELESLNDRRKWHLSRLEIVLRLLINGTLLTDRVNDLKEDISYFVESNTVRSDQLRFPAVHPQNSNSNRRKTLKRTRVSTTN